MLTYGARAHVAIWEDEIVSFDDSAVLGERAPGKFADPDWTATRERRATVALDRLETLWINTGTLCNITCQNCYIESSPSNDRLVYITAAEAAAYFDEIETGRLGTREIGFTGGEPFMNPHLLAMVERRARARLRGAGAHQRHAADAAAQDQARAARPAQRFGARLTLRVSLDHYGKALHEAERGARTWARTIAGLDWLAAERLPDRHRRAHLLERERGATRARAMRSLIAEHGWPIDAADPAELVLLPEMDGRHDVPEITTRCWAILKKSPGDMMCATSRMVVKRQGAERPTVRALHADPLRAGLRDGRRRWRTRPRPTAACSRPAPSSSATRTARSSACWAAAAARRARSV